MKPLEILACDLYQSNFYANGDYKFLFAALGVGHAAITLAGEVAMRKISARIEIAHAENLETLKLQHEASEEVHKEIIGGYRFPYHRFQIFRVPTFIFTVDDQFTKSMERLEPGRIEFIPSVDWNDKGYYDEKGNIIRKASN